MLSKVGFLYNKKTLAHFAFPVQSNYIKSPRIVIIFGWRTAQPLGQAQGSFFLCSTFNSSTDVQSLAFRPL